MDCNTFTVDCTSPAKSKVKSSKPHVHSSKPLALRLTLNKFTDRIIHSHASGFELCTCGFELLTLLFARLMQSTVDSLNLKQ